MTSEQTGLQLYSGIEDGRGGKRSTDGTAAETHIGVHHSADAEIFANHLEIGRPHCHQQNDSHKDGNETADISLPFQRIGQEFTNNGDNQQKSHRVYRKTE